MHSNGGGNPALSILNRTPSLLKGPGLLHDLVRQTSDCPAIDFLENGSKRRKFGYETLHTLSDALAEKILKIATEGDSDSHIIPVLLPQCPELYVALLAVLKAGKAFCPLNLDTPTERLDFILGDLRADLLITTSKQSASLHIATRIRTVLIDRELSKINNESTLMLPLVGTNDVAYVLYTSGSTGLPKAVSVSHRAVTQSLLAHNQHIPDFTRFLQFAAPTFDVSVFEIFFPWCRGRTLVGCTRTQMLDNLPKVIQDLEVDAAELTPTVVSSLLHGRSSVPSLKLLLTIGEMLTQHVIAEYGGDGSKESILWAMYGPTEAAIHCTLQPHLSTSSPVGTIGYPLPTVSTFILAPCSELHSFSSEVLPIGEVGELVIGGPQIANGYLNRPELTADAFINHPDYGRLYRTGDRVRLCNDGTLECFGRIVAGQVKLRGQRVELGEIEQAIMRLDSCRSVIVMIIADSLIAFCATGSETISRTTVLDGCRRWLPGYMVPQDVYFTYSMPQLPSGKVDRRALELRYLQKTHRNDEYTSGLDQLSDHPVLRVIRQHTRQALSLDIDLTFAGLDSLQAIRVVSDLRKEGYNISAVAMLSSRTIRDLVAYCEDRENTNRYHELPDILVCPLPGPSFPQLQHCQTDVECVLPCTPLQEAMLAETMSRPRAYCNWVEIEAPASHTCDELRKAIQILAQGNEILRTGFCTTTQTTDSFHQVVWKDLPMSLMREVAHFSKIYSLESEEALLRPLAVQINMRTERPRMLFQMHHALYDGWSLDLLLQDLDKLLCKKTVARRPQFREIVRYHRSNQQVSHLKADEEYWADLLADHIPISLPNFNGRIIEDTGSRSFTRRSTVQTILLMKRTLELGISPQVFFQAAVAYILGLYSNSHDVVFGNVTSGRTIAVTEVENIVGPCIASLPFRLNFEGLYKIQDVLNKVQSINRESLQHCSVPLRDIVRAAGVRPGSRLFDVLFVWQQSLSSVSEPSHAVKVVDSADDLEYKVTIEFEPQEHYISFRATYDPSTIPESQIKYLSLQVDEVVRTFLEDTDRKMADLNFDFKPEDLAIANPYPYQPSSATGPSWAVEKWANEHPKKEAIVFAHLVEGVLEVQESATYSTLNRRANQLARGLLERGVGQDQLVAIIMEKSVDLYIAILAVLKLGSGYLPLIPDTPVDRIRTILRDAQVSICISESTVSGVLQRLSVNMIDLDMTDFSCYSSHNLNVSYSGHHLAYAVFTSGSTGTPKGVLVTQDNLMSNLHCLSRIYPFSTDSRMLQSCSQAFDVSVFEIFFSWHVGICLCTAKTYDLFRDFEATINRLGITHLSLTPTVASLVDPKNVPNVEFLVTAGEALTEHVRRNWAGKGLYQGYGPSETTNICTVRTSVSLEDLINNIGSPFDNTSAFVIDPRNDQILPRGAVGELCFGGAQVFRGYLNKPDLTASKIIRHPTYGRIYRSGDMGILLPDDSILFTGRLDDQVKIRGQRVELGEITSILLDHALVQDCVTLLLLCQSNTKSLVSFWVPATDWNATFRSLNPTEFRSVTAQLFASLSLYLPSYMIPSHLVPIACLPMTKQGKIDKQLLHNTFDGILSDVLGDAAQSQDMDREHEAASEWEIGVAKVLSQTLDLITRDVKRTLSFFNLGLDSVSAIRFCNGLRQANLGDFAVPVVMKNPTIAHLASLKERQPPSEQSYKPPTADPTRVFSPSQIAQILAHYKNRGLRTSRILPCTPLQEAMLSSGQRLSESVYCNVMMFNITGNLAHLKRCWAHMVRRHDILRTSFVSTEDPSYAFAQVILEDYEMICHPLDLQDDVVAHTNCMVFELLQANKPPVFFATVQAGASTKLLFCCHHALYDGIAIAILLQEIQEHYHGLELAPPVSYDVYLQHMLSQDIETAHQYWAATFTDFEPSLFPNLTGRLLKDREQPASVNRKLQLSLSKVRAACQNASVSLLSIIQATWAKLLHFYTGEDDLCFGNIVNGRTLPGEDLARLVAPCFNTLPVRVKFDFRDKNFALVDILQLSNIESLAHQLTSLRRIQSLALKDGGRLFDTLVILQQATPSLDASIWTLEQDLGDMDLPVVCEVHQDPLENVLKLVLHYDNLLLSKADALIVAETFEACLSTLVEYPHISANDAMNLPSHLRAESNLNWQRIDKKPLLHLAFELRASLQPDVVGLDFAHPDGTRTTWSYKTLNDKANGIAHALIDNGVQLEDIVPIYMSKSPNFYASILGILKAGAAFAPVHPGLPNLRKEFMFTELRSKIVLCSKVSIPSSSCTRATIVIVEDIGPAEKGNPDIRGLTGSSLAYCLFTSGSTGAPKAVSMEHDAPVHTIESSRRLIPWDNSSRLLQFAAVTFDMCYYDCFLAWSFGFTLCAAHQDMMLNELPKVINTLEVDLLDLTPSVAVSLRRSEVPKVKWLYCIGEAMSPGLVEEWNGACVNSYGPTETAYCTTIHPVSKNTNISVIGKPFQSTLFTVFPLQGVRPLPLLSTGELYIGGAQLARGYLGRPELTEDRFVMMGGQRFYKTGDLVRMLSDGNFEFIGRTDDQVKIRGLRVELGEINHVLLGSCSAITTVTTQILKKEAAARSQLVSFIVAQEQLTEDECAATKRQLKQIAQDQLPPYMVPEFFIFIEKIPKSMAGKIDRHVLTKIFLDSGEMNWLQDGTVENTPEHQWTLLEEQVREILSRLSRVPLNHVLSTTTIYQLGLDSISAVQIAASLRKNSHRINASNVMKHMTCTGIAACIDKGLVEDPMSTPEFDLEAFDRKHRASITKACGFKDKDVVAIRPCTPLQKGMLSQLLAKEGALYMNSLRLHLSSKVNMKKMELAWTAAMERHRMLRTGFTQLRDALHPFAMIHYSSNAVKLPWSVEEQDSFFESTEDWLRGVQHRVLSNMHTTTWAIRVDKEVGSNYLDIALFHGLFDAHSLHCIFNDVVAAYHDEQLSKPVPLDPVISDILRSVDQGLESGREFWTNLGKKANPCRFPNLAPLRYDPSTPAVYTKQAATPLAELSSGCRDANITIQAAGVASWLSLLSAYTGELSVTCGIVLSGRNSEASTTAVFPCINTVPFVGTPTSDRKSMLEAVMTLNSEVQQHQFTPLNEIQKLMGFPNESLFDTIFAYQKLSNEDHLNDLWVVVDEKASTEYPISIELEPKGAYLEYRLSFLPHLIPKEQVSLILDQLDHLMESFIFSGDPTTTEPVLSLPLYSITPAKELSLPSEVQLLHQFVELMTKKHPQRIAFEFAHSIHESGYSGRSWTYSELDGEGNRVANLLISHGIQPGSLIGICFEKCPEASFAMLGVLKAGCAFVAIDPSAPAGRQAFVINDSKAGAVLSMATQSARYKEDINVPILNLDEMNLSLLPATKCVLKREVRPEDCSYCLYTSGTTGTPKGCELTHANAVQALLAFQRLFAGHWDADSRWLQFASFHFDVSVLEQYWSWSVGICVVSAPRDLIFEDLATSISSLRITHIDLTPSLAQILHPDDVPSLCKGVFITGGESLKQEILDVWGPKSVIYNGYGPTEATIGVTMYPRVPANGKPSNIGSQFENVGTYVLQPGSDVPVLRGGVGELCVSGALVGKGYLNRPELTAERFPHLHRFNERVYRTGDLVRILHDGSFEFLGRIDDQVKLRGQRLEVGEINSVIKQSNKSVSDVATLVLKHPNQQKEQLVAFVVLSRSPNPEPRVLLSETSGMTIAKEACQDKLPPYMVPTHFVPLTSMPLNVNNKANARRLRELYNALSSSDLLQLSAVTNNQDDTWSTQDQKLRQILMETLNLGEDSITKDASFFELGMDSISVISVARAMKNARFHSATASVVMRYPTIRRLIKALAIDNSATDYQSSLLAAQQTVSAIQHRHRRAVARSVSLDIEAIEALAPCTPLQQGMIARYLESEDGLYFNTFQFRLGKNVREDQLRAAWECVYASNPILRTVFANTEDGYVQAVLRDAPLNWLRYNIKENESIIDCTQKLRQKWLQLNRTELKRLFEVVLVRIAKESVLLVHIFHGLYDGISIGLTFDAVWTAYNECKQGNKAPSFHFALAHGPLRIVGGAKTFWRNHLANTVFRPFPVLTKSSNGEPVVVIRQLDMSTTFESLRRRLNVTAQAIAQACWLSVLQGHIHQAITTGIAVSGRSIDLEGVDRIVGPMFNTIPYHHTSQRNKSWTSIIERVHEFNVAAHPYQHTPLRDIMKWCKRPPNQPLFDNLFVYQIGQDRQEWAKNSAWELLDGDVVADYPLALEIEQGSEGKLKLTLVTQGYFSDERTSNELLNRFAEALDQLVADPTYVPDIAIGTVDVIDSSFRDSNDTKNDLHDHVEFEWTMAAAKIREEIASLCEIGLSEINETTSIFELGLDSIDAIKLSSKLKKHEIDIPISGIMRSLTIAKMVQHLSTSRKPKQQDSSESKRELRNHDLRNYLKRNSFDLTNIVGVFPPTPLQEAMVAEMVASKYMRYYNYDVLKLNPDTNIGKLRDAWTRVVEASQILRTGFVEVGDPDLDESFVQVIHKHPHEFWSSIRVENEPDFTALFAANRHNTAGTALSQPAFRILLIEGPTQNYLMLSIAHALYDGWSLGLLHLDVQRAYHENRAIRSSYESALANIISTSGAEAAEFWQDNLTGAKPTSFPRRRDIFDQGSTIVHRCQQLSQVTLIDAMAFARKSNISLQTIGQTVFSLVSAFYTHSLDVTFGCVLSGRDDEERSQLLFPTMNTVAIRTILHGTGMELLRYVQDNFTRIKQWQHFPLRKAISLAGAGGKLFESLFIYQKSLEEIHEAEEKLYTSVEGHSDVEYPVCVEMEIMNGELVWRCAVKEEVFLARGAKDLLDRLDDVLMHIMKQPHDAVMGVTSQGISVCSLPAFKEIADSQACNTSVADEGENDSRPTTNTEENIRKVLALVAKLPEEELTKDMTIFHMGLDSISAIKVSLLLRKQDIVLSIGEMLRAGTVEKMAHIVDERATVPANLGKENDSILEEVIRDLDRLTILQRVGIDDADVEDILPATAGQLYMLSMWLNTKGANFYPEFPYEVHGSVTFSILQRSWHDLFAANPILGTRFVRAGDYRTPYVQIVLRNSNAMIADITGLSEDEIAMTSKQLAPTQPWVHLLALQTSTGWKLRLKIHHALYDGVSLPLVMQQFQDLCNDMTLPAPNNAFTRLITTSYAKSSRYGRKSFWTKYLDGLKQRPVLPSLTTSTSKTGLLRPALLQTSSLENTARGHGVSMQSIFLAIFGKIFAEMKKTGITEDVVIGVYLANRSLPIENIVTAAVPALNLLPLRVRSPLEYDILELATQIQSDLQIINSPANVFASLFDINEWTGIKIDTFVNFLSFPDADDSEGLLRSESAITIKLIEKWQEPVSRVSPIEDRSGEVLAELRDERVNGAYLHAIDVEATIRNGALDVGVFANADLLSLEEGENLIEDIRMGLAAV